MPPGMNRQQRTRGFTGGVGARRSDGIGPDGGVTFQRAPVGWLALLCVFVARSAYAQSAPPAVVPTSLPTVFVSTSGSPNASAQPGVPVTVSGDGTLAFWAHATPYGAPPTAQCSAPCQILVQPGPLTLRVVGEGGVAWRRVVVPPVGASIQVARGHGRSGLERTLLWDIGVPSAGLGLVAFVAGFADSTLGSRTDYSVETGLFIAALALFFVADVGLLGSLILRHGRSPRIDVAQLPSRPRWVLGAAPLAAGATSGFGLRF